MRPLPGVIDPNNPELTGDLEDIIMEFEGWHTGFQNTGIILKTAYESTRKETDQETEKKPLYQNL